MTFVGRDEVKSHFQRYVARGFNNPQEIVKYAILSHRWLDRGEMTYQKMKSRRNSARSPGYRKLMKFCEKARMYGVEFAWSDTCCIDKSSSTEIDESIRSMFQWYRNSHICIIHLAQSETIQDIKSDTWMKRGWTLQELLAPYRIKLYNRRWVPMTDDENDKSQEGTEVMKALEEATGIHPDYLLKFMPGPVKVDERMAWAAERNTKRVEDVAYSLMGIFDVSLQIAYGEGADRAFCRLIEAIMRAGDPSVLNWVGEAAKHHSSSAIPQSPKNFVGQKELPQRLGWRLDMTMTSLGLRVPVVILPLDVTSTDRKSVEGYEPYYRVTLESPHCPTVRTFFPDVAIPHRKRQFALGIVNYSIGSCNVPRIQGRSIGFILYKDPEANVNTCEPKSEHVAGLHVVFPSKSEFTPWRKVNKTGLVEVDLHNEDISSDSFFYVDPNRHLETIYV